MKTKKILVITAAMMLTLVLGLSMVDQEESDATVSIIEAYQDTITPDGGTIYVQFNSTEGVDREITITITNSNTGSTVGTATITIPADTENYKASVHVNLGGTGEYNIKITCAPTSYFDNKEAYYTTTITVNVTESIWSSWTAYAAIIIVVIIIVIAIFLHMRNAPKIKPDKTFTELESERNDGKPSRSTERIASSTERKKYKSTKSETTQEPPVKKTEPVKEEPKKAQSFTEMEEKKKVAKEKKDSSDDTESKKPKYVSSRRK
ncbi:MAG: DUF3244 domain-containing protein [Candidatus Methanogranum gryphiswaldense]|nr:MAG: DUF3244 domain-containing protein [Candidatus Methanogranum sp. U3.2.1]